MRTQATMCLDIAHLLYILSVLFVSCQGVRDEKDCQGVGVVHADNIDSFRNCTIIEGSLTILDTSFQGFQEVYSNFTFGAFHKKMHPSKLEIFSTLKEVTGFVSIQASHPDFVNLSYFRNLEVIDGRQLTELSAALYIVRTSLQSLNMHSLKKVRSGSIVILENQDLCFASSIDWDRIIHPTNTVLLQRNAEKEVCEKKGLVCHPQCSKDGCWGVGPDECLSCASYSLGDSCVKSCNSSNGLYDAGDKQCKPCDNQCLGECYGPGPGNCSQCLNVRDGPYCYAECPERKYNHSGECLPCHKNCVEGCTGPENTIGEGGCNSCEKAIVSAFDPNVVEQCLKADEHCPDGFYSEYIGTQQEGPLKFLRGKRICRKCHYKKKFSQFIFPSHHYSTCSTIISICRETFISYTNSNSCN